jgi:glycosyltransferase involved in cell wall biosynthesis
MTIHPLHPEARSLSIGFLTPHNALDRRAFSGSAFFAAQALDAHPQLRLRFLGPARTPSRFDRVLRRKLLPVDVDQMDLSDLDVVVGMVATPQLERLSRLSDVPFIHVTDATPAFLRDAYGWATSEEADRLETLVAAKAAATVYSSDIMAARAPHDLGLPGLTADVLPFGVNFDDLPTACPTKPPLSTLNLLFVGLDWTRKGGDIAVAALDQLLADGVDAHLTIVGRCPESHRKHPAITYAGFLDKNRPRDAAKLTRLYTDAHLLLLPSRGDCTPIVVAEAMAHGTPVVATDVGGIPAQVGGDGAGRILPLYSDARLWADAIKDVTETSERYRWASDASFDRASRRFSWGTWADGIQAIAARIKYGDRIKPRDQKVAVGH